MAPILQLRELGLEQIPAGAPAGPSCATLYLRDSLPCVRAAVHAPAWDDDQQKSQEDAGSA